MTTQATLFDFSDEPKPAKHAVVSESGPNWDLLNKYAFCYTITETGTNSGIRFMTTIEDAKKWCSTDVSAGVLHGTRWAYAWTSVANFVKYHTDFSGSQKVETYKVTLEGLTDNLSWDDRIAAAGVHKIGLDQIADILEPAGVECEGRPTMGSHQKK